MVLSVFQLPGPNINPGFTITAFKPSATPRQTYTESMKHKTVKALWKLIALVGVFASLRTAEAAAGDEPEQGAQARRRLGGVKDDVELVLVEPGAGTPLGVQCEQRRHERALPTRSGQLLENEKQ